MIKKVLLFPVFLLAINVNAQSINSGGNLSQNMVDAKDVASQIEQLNFSIFLVPEKDLIVIQKDNLNKDNTEIELFNSSGQSVQKTILYQGSTIAFFDTKSLYDGEYVLKIYEEERSVIRKLRIKK